MSKGLFLAIVTVAVIGIGLIGIFAIAPISLIGTAFYCFWDASKYEDNLNKEYNEYRKRTRLEFLKKNIRKIIIKSRIEYMSHHGLTVDTYYCF